MEAAETTGTGAFYREKDVEDYSAQIIDKCVGCEHILTQPPTLEVPEIRTCRVYLFPESKWRIGNCVMATHVKKEGKKDEKQLNSIKASKRSMKGK